MQYMNEQLLKFLAMGLLLPSLASERKVFRDLAGTQSTSKKAKRRKRKGERQDFLLWLSLPSALLTRSFTNLF